MPVNEVKIESHAKGFDFYAAKDAQMAKDADYGFMIWNGKSKGTYNNMINLIRFNRIVLLYYTPHQAFYTIQELDDINTISKKEDNNSTINQTTLF